MKSVAVLALAVCPLFGQHQHTGAPAQEKPVILYPGLGAWKHPIAARNPEAQSFFNQGLVLLYGFNRYEALRSFRKAHELDPSAAMAQWGISMALGPYLNMDMDPDVHPKESCEAAQAGLRTAGISAVDRDWLDAAASRCPDYSDPRKYVSAMRALAAKYPDDPDAQTLYAESLLLLSRWHWYGKDAKPADGVVEAEHVLEEVLRREPQHPGANHFYIHAVESSPTPERAVPSAYRLMGIVPAAGHMVHMPGHIWLLLGDYQTAVDVNERAVQVDRDYFAKTGVVGSYYPYYLHNLQFILYARAMQGRVAQTKQAVAQFEAALSPMAAVMPEMAEAFSIFATMTRLRAALYDDLLAQPRPKSENPLTLAMWHYGRALSFAAQRKMDQAVSEQKQFEDLRKKVDVNIPLNTNKLGDVLDLAAAILDARTEASPAAAVAKWKNAVEMQDRLAYDEPPAWYYPVRESLGAALLRSGDPSGAEAVFREGLRRSPKNGRMLFGLLESLKAQRKTDDAAWVQSEFTSAWKGAELSLRIEDL